MNVQGASLSDAERRDRFIAHMNREHTYELTHFLRHYAGLTAAQARGSGRGAGAGPVVQDASLAGGMTIRVPGTSRDVIVPFSAPPPTSWDEVRARVVDMDAEARRALGGLSDVRITAYAPPRPGDWAVLLAVAFYFACYATLPLVRPDTKSWALVDAVFPGGVPWYAWVVRTLFLPVMAVHITELFVFDRTRMRRHGVPRWSAVWWAWEASNFFEGVMAFKRLDAVVAAKRLQKEKRLKKL